MNNPIYNLLATTNWWFVITSTIIAMIIGAIWFSPKVFGTLYGKRMNIDMDCSKTPKEEQMKEMMRSMAGELVSRFLYYLWLGQALAISWWTDLTSWLIFTVVVWLIFIFSTQLSQISWSMVDRRVLWLITGSSLLSSLIATVLWFAVFN
jgi:Protein of unknown function (DUF1761)